MASGEGGQGFEWMHCHELITFNLSIFYSSYAVKQYRYVVLIIYNCAWKPGFVKFTNSYRYIYTVHVVKFFCY